MIGIDARAAFLDPHRGFGRVTRSLIDALLPLAPGEVVLFAPRGSHVPEPWYRLAASVVQLRRPRRAALLFDGPAWRSTLRRHPVDVLYLPAWGVPRGMPVPVLATFHDATPFRFPSPASRWKRWRSRVALRSLRRASLVHAVSAHAAREAIAFSQVDPGRVEVVEWGVGAPFRPADPEPGREHVLYLGGVDPHKNLAVVLDAYSLPGAEVLPPLVVAGPVSPAELPDVGRRLVAERRLRVESRPQDDTVVDLLQRALVLVLPSFNEGFALPALEAMACGAPVVWNQDLELAHLEAGGGPRCPASSPTRWLEALVDMHRDLPRRQAIVRRGLAYAAAHTWENTARGLLGLLETAATPRLARPLLCRN